MKAWRFIWQSWRFDRLALWGVLAAAAVATMVLLGALLAGDSVKGTLRQIAEWRTGRVERILSAGEGFMGEEVAAAVRGGESAGVLFLQGQVTAGERSAAQTQVLGVEEDFWRLGPSGGQGGSAGWKPTAQEGSSAGWKPTARGEVALSEALAADLEVGAGDEVILRVPKPGLLSADAPVANAGGGVEVMRATVGRVLGAADFARFGLEMSQVAPRTIFLPRAELQSLVGLEGKVNLILAGAGASLEADELSLAAYGLTLKEVTGAVELRSERIFLRPELAELMAARFPEGVGVLTYLCNTLATKERETPYSMVTATEAAVAPFLPEDLGADEIVINEWLAEDLAAEAGDEIRLDFYAVGAGSRLVERSADFRVRVVVPMAGAAAERAWMPDFPGVAAVESARDWDPSLPLDLTRIRDQDDAYWEEFRGTPKAFVALAAGRDLWQNRWGSLTAFRVPGAELETVAAGLREGLDPALMGWQWVDFAAQAQAGAESPVDFAGLFLSMSFFLIVAALALVVMVFRLSIEQRTTESGLLAALGVPAGRVRAWRLAEAGLGVGVGALLGALLAVAFCAVILRVIGSIWEGAEFLLVVRPGTVFMGIVLVVGAALGAVWWSLRRLGKVAARWRLSQGAEEEARGRGWFLLVPGGLSLLAGVLLGLSNAQGFFLAGFGLLLLGLGAFKRSLRREIPLRADEVFSLARVNVARRGSRALTVVGVLAAGVFLVLSVSVFRKDGGEDWAAKESGAGGFAWLVEAGAPLARPADAEGEIAWFGLREGVVPLRAGAGDVVDCFNLSASRNPRLLGVPAGSLDGRFTFGMMAEGVEPSWDCLRAEAGKTDGAVPALVDETTLLWVLKMKPGELLSYRDESGAEFPVRIVGTLKESIFQGQLLVDEEALLAKFPSLGGYGMFLVAEAGAEELLRVEAGDQGARVISTQERLAAFHGVENTYIGIFNVLGGLGLILASAGLGVVTARNLAERRDEMRILEVLGLAKGARRKLILAETNLLVRWGLGVGVAAAALAVLPLLGRTLQAGDLVWMVLLTLLMAVVARLRVLLALGRVNW
ncbi:MAG: FtsX-like permease family protein [Verrucomicrobiales bacterium]